VRLYDCVHVGFEAELRVNAFSVEFDFNERVWVRSNDEVNLRPVDHDHLLQVVDHVWQLARRHPLQRFVSLRRPKLPIHNFVFVEPLRAEQFLLSSLIRVIRNEVRQHIVLLLLAAEEAIVILPNVLVHSRNEVFALANFVPFVEMIHSFVLFSFQVIIVRVGHPLIVSEEAATRKINDFTLWWFEC